MSDLVVWALIISFMCGVVFLSLHIMALLIHEIYLAPFLAKHGARGTSFFRHWIIGTGMIQDCRFADTVSQDLRSPPRGLGLLYFILVLDQLFLWSAVLLLIVAEAAFLLGK